MDKGGAVSPRQFPAVVLRRRWGRWRGWFALIQVFCIINTKPAFLAGFAFKEETEST